MWMTDYIRAVQQAFIDQAGFKEDPEKPGIPLGVPDGEYPLQIDGKVDKVRITKGMISCCNFEEEQPT